MCLAVHFGPRQSGFGAYTWRVSAGANIAALFMVSPQPLSSCSSKLCSSPLLHEPSPHLPYGRLKYLQVTRAAIRTFPCSLVSDYFPL